METFSTEQAAEMAGLKLTTFNQRARQHEIKPTEFVKSDNGGRPKARWTMEQITMIKNLRGNKRTQPKEQPTAVDVTSTEIEPAKVTASNDDTDQTQAAKVVVVDNSGDTAQIITIKPSSVVSLEERANRIRRHMQDICNSVIAVGFELIAAKEQVGHGNWSTWLKSEFEWTERTAENYMRIAERFGNGKIENVFDFKSSTLIKLLALPEGDEQAFIAEQAESGKPLENQSARQVQASVKQWKKKRAEETTTDTLQAENNSPEEVKGTYFDLRGNDENSLLVEELNHETINTAVIRNLIDSANDLQTVKAIRDSLLKLVQEIGEIVLLTEAKIGELQKNNADTDGENQ